MEAAPPTVDFCTILCESKKIMKAHSRHFLALSVLFLLPISFSFSVLPVIEVTVTGSEPNHTEILLRYHNPQEQEPQQRRSLGFKTLVLLSVLYAVTVLTLFLSATGAITYSVYHGFFGRPVKFVSAVKSLSNSLLRLFVTAVYAGLFVLGVTGVIGLVMVVGVKGIELLGFDILHSGDYMYVVYAIGLVVLGLGLFYLEVNWALVFVIVVVESSWGLEPLRRSVYLVKGLRGVAASLRLFYGVVTVVMVLLSWELSVGSDVLGDVLFVTRTVVASACVMVLMLYNVATDTVLYMYCKALHGELAMEIVEEFAWDYLSLPFDEGKVPHVVSFVQPSEE